MPDYEFQLRDDRDRKTASDVILPKGDALGQHELQDELAADHLTATDVKGPSPALAALAPAVAKVADPVAFMTSAGETEWGTTATSRGSYNLAIGDKGAEGGFYEQAKAECDRLIGAIQEQKAASAAAPPPGPEHLSSLENLLLDYRVLYDKLQSAGASQEDADDVSQHVSAMEGSVYGLPAQALGAAFTDRIVHAFTEITTFVASWSDIKGAYGGKGQLSAGMWAGFLQTVERERQILNNYGLLEERGGSGEGTHEKAIADERGYTVTDPKEAREIAEKDGGFMAQALKTYSAHARNMELYRKQIFDVQQRVLSGEFETMEQAVEAFKRGVGGGLASDAFYEELDALAKGTWNIAMGEKRVQEEEQFLKGAQADQRKAQRKLHAYGNSFDNAVDSYEDHSDAATNRDKLAADEAWNSAVAYRNLAEGYVSEAEDLVKEDVPAKLDAAANKHAEARAHLETAKNYATLVDTDRYDVLAGGVNRVERRAKGVEQALKANEETRAKVEKLNEQIIKNAEAARAHLDKFDELGKIEVPAPSLATGKDAGGTDVKLSHYEKIAMELGGRIPGAPFMKLFGGIEGGITWGESLTTGDKETKLSEAIFFGVKIDLWLFEMAIKWTGKLEGTVKDMVDVGTAYDLIHAEKSNMDAYAEWDEHGYLPKMLNAIETYPARAESEVYQPLLRKAEKIDGKGKDRKARREFDRQVEESADKIREIQGDDFDGGLHGALTDTFGHLNFWQNLHAQFALTDGSDLAEDIELLKTVADTFLHDETRKVFDGWQDNKDHVVDNIKEKLDEIDFLHNDPNVTVTSSDEVEVSAEADAGRGASFGVKVAHVWSRTDGEGEYMNAIEQQSTIYGLEISAGGWKGSIEAENKSDGTSSLKASARLPGAAPTDKGAEDEMVHSVVDRAKMLTDVLQGKIPDADLMNDFEDWVTELDAVEDLADGPSFGAKDYILVEMAVEWKDGELAKVVVSVGYEIESKLEFDAGVLEGSASHRSGTKLDIEIPV